MKNYWVELANNSLQMWTNDIDYIITRSEEEAEEIAMKTMGYGKDDLEEVTWYKMSLDSMFTYRTEDGDDVKKTVKEFIKEYGEGYFACSEY